jgi:hypothetical protein
MPGRTIHLDINGKSSEDTAAVLQEWFNSPFMGRRALPRGVKRVAVTVNGSDVAFSATNRQLATTSPTTLIDGFVAHRVGLAHPLRVVDAWISANPDILVRTSVMGGKYVELSATEALKSVIAQIIIDDLQLLAPMGESVVQPDLTLAFDEVLNAMMPTDTGRALRESLISGGLRELAVQRELFASLQMLLPESSSLFPIVAQHEKNRSFSVHSHLSRLQIQTLAQLHLFRLHRNHALARSFAHLPKSVVYLLYKLIGGDHPLESWRLTEKPVSVETWMTLQNLSHGRQ